MRKSRGITLAIVLASAGCSLDRSGTSDNAPTDAGFDTSGTCTNATRDGDESDIDCGGSCAKCGAGKTCRGPSDCELGVCEAGRCGAPPASCSNKTRDGDETDVDCGGSCPKCAVGASCSQSTDCVTGSCAGGKCATVSCTDGARNGTESDVDCGGGCPPCAATKGCFTGKDCASRWCDAAVCQNVRSCKQLKDLDATLPSGTYTLDPDGPGGNAPFSAYCDMVSDGGGWTLVAHVDATTVPPQPIFGTSVGTYQGDARDDGTTYSCGAQLLPHVPHTSMLVALDSADIAVAAAAKKVVVYSYAIGAPVFNSGPAPCTGSFSGASFRVGLTGAFSLLGPTSTCDVTKWHPRGPTPESLFLAIFEVTGPGTYWGRGMGGDDSWGHDAWWFVR